MRAHLALAVVTLTLGCLSLDPVPDLPPTLHVLSVSVLGAALDAIPRLPTVIVRFDHRVNPPDPDSIVLVTGVDSPTLQTDAARLPLPTTLATRKITVALGVAPGDPQAIAVTPTQPLLPDTTLVLLVTPRVHGPDTAVFDNGDGGIRAVAYALQVAPARACAPWVTLLSVDGVSPAVGRMRLRLDRPVHSTGASARIAALVDGTPIPARWSLDCLLPNAEALCAWVEPVAISAPETSVIVRLDGIVGRNGLPPENTPMVVLRGAPAPTALTLGPQPLCTDGETAVGDTCISGAGNWLTVRASTAGIMVLRAEAVPTAPDGGLTPAALSSPGTLHTLTLRGMRPGEGYELSIAPALGGLTAAGLDIGRVTTAANNPLVRIGEVLYRPRGGAAQAYIELVNDGGSAADVSGWVVRMQDRSVALPDGAMVPARGRGVVVGVGFNPLGVPAQGDPPVAAGASLIALSGTLSRHGLRSAGTDITLEDPSGTLMSYVPGGDPRRGTALGVGLVRAAMDLSDDDPAAWSWDALATCTPGGPDHLR